MTLLGKSYKNLYNKEKGEYTLPVIVTKEHDEISFKHSFVLSFLLHPMTVMIGWLISVLLIYLGFNLSLFKTPERPMRDIEFVLVDKEDTPINKNTKYRADRNSRAGGVHDPKKAVSMPSPEPAKKIEKKSSSSASSDLQKMIKKQQKQVVQQAKQQKQQTVQKQEIQKPVEKQKVAPPMPQKVVEQPKKIDAPKALAPRPASVPSAPKVASVPKSNFQIPTPKVAEPKLGPAQGGPVAGTSAGTKVGANSSSGSTSKGSGSAAPSFAPAKNAYSTGGTGGQGRFSGSGTSSAGGHGSAGNPGPGGNPNGRPGIDAIREADFGPYMRDLQRRIKMNWDPPKGNESKRVVLLFSISRDGRLLNVKVSKTSGVPAADRAAVSAVQLSAPFKPLPSEFKGSKVDIQFTFDYNVFGASSYY